MRYEVEMLAFGEGKIRQVDVPNRVVENVDPPYTLLDWIFKFGQNDFQPRSLPSVSVGDVVRLDGKRFRVENCGFKELD